MNNPLFAMMQMMQGGGDPMRVLQGMAGNDPRIAQFMRMVNGRSPTQLRQMAENMAKERGITLDDVVQQLRMRK